MEVAEEVIKAKPNVIWVPLTGGMATAWRVMGGEEPGSRLTPRKELRGFTFKLISKKNFPPEMQMLPKQFWQNF